VILCYHKIDLKALTHWWVSADAFNRQMADLQAYDVVTLDDYQPGNADQAVITFDGVYSDVARFAAPILRKWGYPCELFVIGDHVGGDNGFDQHVEPPASFASIEDLELLVECGARVQWHTRSHRVLGGLSDQALADELTPAAELAARFGAGHMRWFAYPHGESDDRVRAAVETRFDGAVSVVQGAAGDRYALPRLEVDEATSLSRSTVSVVVPNFNYGRFLPDALESVFGQLGRVDQVLVIDDASTDGSQEIMRRYEDRALLEFNGTNLGIVGNFRKAIDLTDGDYVVFLGADNRMRSDFVERTKAALDGHPEAAIAYTDIAIFGPRSHVLAQTVGAHPTAASDVYIWRFPEPTPERLAAMGAGENFVHGSSMYRRADYEAAGGYRAGSGPEDHDLFRRMLERGRGAVRVAEPLLAYRQHSAEQANTRLIAQMEAAYQTRRADGLTVELRGAQARADELRSALAAREAEVAGLRERSVGTAEELEHIRRRAATLDAVEAGGWWRLRARVLPLLRLAARLRGLGEGLE
jgi:peptidoglycan/xylan/chitin deacetylase (PgdA/CDA1 family)